MFHNVVQPPPLSSSKTSLRKGNCMPINCHFPFSSSPSPWQPVISFPSPWMYLFWVFSISGFGHHLTFCVWLLSLSTLLWRVIHTVAWTSTSLLFTAESYCTDRPPLSIRSSVHGLPYLYVSWNDQKLGRSMPNPLHNHLSRVADHGLLRKACWHPAGIFTSIGSF